MQMSVLIFIILFFASLVNPAFFGDAPQYGLLAAGFLLGVLDF